MDANQMNKLQEIAKQSPYAANPELMKQPFNSPLKMEDLNKLVEGLPNPPEVPVPAPQQPRPVAGLNRKQRRNIKKRAGAKRTNRDRQVHEYAERVRRMSDGQIWNEGHKEPSPEIIEKVVRDIHEDLLSVLAPHFGDDIMKKIDEVLSKWYQFDGGYTVEGPVREGGIDRPLTDADRTLPGGILGGNNG